MIYFDNITEDFEPIPIDPAYVEGVHRRVNGTTLINLHGHRDVITSTEFFEVCYAIGAANVEKEKSSTRGKRILD